jgi:hypothetical protein
MMMMVMVLLLMMMLPDANTPGLYLGVHRFELDAAAAYDAASRSIPGPKAVVNFPETNHDIVDWPRAPPKWLVDHLVQLVRCFSAVFSDLGLERRRTAAARALSVHHSSAGRACEALRL